MLCVKGVFFLIMLDRYSGIPTQFICLRGRLSQAWLSPTLLVLIGYILKLVLLKKFLMASLDMAFLMAKESCNAVNEASKAAAQTHQELANVANELVSTSVQHTLNGIKDGLGLMVTVVEQLILFAVELTLGTYACLTVSLVDIAASEALNATKSVIDVANSTVQDSVHVLNEGIGSLTNLINGAIGLIDDVTDFVSGGESDIKKVNLTIDNLRKFSISPSIDTKIDKIRSDIPTYDETKAAMKSFIRKPFEEIREGITAQNISFNAKPIRAHNKGNGTQECNLHNFEVARDKIRHNLNIFFIIVVIVLCLALIFTILWSLWASKKQWERLEQAAIDSSVTETSMVAHNRINLANANWPQRFALQKLSGYPIMWQWYVNYICQIPALVLLGIGTAGAVITILEFIALEVFRKAAKTLGHEANSLEGALNRATSKELNQWYNSTNMAIASTENQINDELLGWVRKGSSTVNSSLSHFMTTINKEIDNVFGNTPFQKPVKAVANCLIGEKVETVDRGLTWIHSKAHVNMARLPQNIISTIDNSSSTKALKNDVVASGLKSAENTVKYQLIVQGAVSASLMGVWIIFAVGALFYIRSFSQKLKDNSDPFDDSKTITEKPPLSARVSRFLPGPAKRPVFNHI